jgi:hypothetical protein
MEMVSSEVKNNLVVRYLFRTSWALCLLAILIKFSLTTRVSSEIQPALAIVLSVLLARRGGNRVAFLLRILKQGSAGEPHQLSTSGYAE